MGLNINNTSYPTQATPNCPSEAATIELLPGYRILLHTMAHALGIDNKWIILIGIGFAAFLFIWDYVGETIISILTAEILFLDSHPDYHLVWAYATEKVGRSARVIQANTQPFIFDKDKQNDRKEADAVGASGRFNWKKYTAQQNNGYKLWFGTYWFWDRGTPVFVTRKKLSSEMRNWESICFRTLGWNAQNLTRLHGRMVDWWSSKLAATTTVRTMESRGDDFMWEVGPPRSIRPVETVALEGPMDRLIKDIEYFIRPSTTQWYRERGLPHRRGVLLHGPPGCGKTTLVRALAGELGLDICLVDLALRNLSEATLTRLLNELPRRCIVLIEDIDAVSLKRKPGHNANRRSSGRLSLSALLNSIDGVAASEGRVLIMTSNNPKKLDEALIRHGRVDLKMKLELASRTQIEKMFSMVFEERQLLPRPGTLTQFSRYSLSGLYACARAVLYSCIKHDHSGVDALENKKTGLALETISKEFANKFSENKFPPATIMSYLGGYANKPLEALQDVDTFLSRYAEENHDIDQGASMCTEQEEDKISTSSGESDGSESE